MFNEAWDGHCVFVYLDSVPAMRYINSSASSPFAANESVIRSLSASSGSVTILVIFAVPVMVLLGVSSSKAIVNRFSGICSML